MTTDAEAPTLDTKYTDADLRGEITQLIENLRAGNELVHPQWVTHAVCKAHQRALVGGTKTRRDRAFFQFTAYTTVRRYARECINALDVEGSEDPTRPSGAEEEQERDLFGFRCRHLHPVYVHRRQGVDVGVPIHLMTAGEFAARAALFRSGARRLVEHADELERFKEYRDSHPDLFQAIGA